MFVNARCDGITQASEVDYNSAGSEKPAVIINTVQLADFLDQPALVLQQGTNQLIPSLTHAWAEDLNDAIAKALLRDFKAAEVGYNFSLINDYHKSADEYLLLIRFDQFHPNDNFMVRASGIFRLVRGSDNKELVSKDFYFEDSLTEDGYAHAVVKLRGIVSRLAEKITGELGSLPQVAGK